MRVRRAKKEDFPGLVKLAGKCGLDYAGMESDDFWVAVEAGRILGICGLRNHRDCLELRSLGVEEDRRGQGIGGKLVSALLGERGADIHLATIIPGFFRRFGFEEAPLVPASMVKDEEWCAGCRKDLCTVMVRKSPVRIPHFPEFKALGLEDKDFFKASISRNPSEACEIHFANMFIWRRFEYSRWTVINGNICLLCESPTEPAYFLQPIGESDLEETVKTCLSAAPRLSRIPESFVGKFRGAFRAEPDRDNFDYVYLARDLAELKGRKYDGKRNRISKFQRSHPYRYLELTPGLIGECRRLFEEWHEEKSPAGGFESGPVSREAGRKRIGRILEAQKEAVLEALTHYEALDFVGGVIETEGRIAAFSIGSRLNSNTAVIHIEIASPEYPGLAQVINQEFVGNACSGFEFINREQDLGLPGLRRAKTSYHPHHLVRKYNLTA